MSIKYAVVSQVGLLQEFPGLAWVLNRCLSAELRGCSCSCLQPIISLNHHLWETKRQGTKSEDRDGQKDREFETEVAKFVFQRKLCCCV